MTSGSLSDYIDGLANGTHILDARQGVTDLPSTSHLECIVHKLDPNYVSVIASDLYGRIYSRRKYTDGWHAWERHAKLSEINAAQYSTDLFETVKNPTFVYWNEHTLNTPWTEKLTTSAYGFAICYGGTTGFQVIFAMVQGSADIFIFARINGEGNWHKK